MYLTNVTYISGILNFLISVVRGFKCQTPFHIPSLHDLTIQVIKYGKDIKLHITNLSNHRHTISYVYHKIIKVRIICNLTHSIPYNFFFFKIHNFQKFTRFAAVQNQF